MLNTQADAIRVNTNAVKNMSQNATQLGLLVFTLGLEMYLMLYITMSWLLANTYTLAYTCTHASILTVDNSITDKFVTKRCLPPQNHAILDLMAKKSTAKRTPTDKQKAFVAEYIDNGLNATQAAQKVYNTATYNSAALIGSENIRKPQLREMIDKALKKNNIDIDTVMGIHKRNMTQQKHLPTSQRAVEQAYTLLGVKPDEGQAKTQIAFIINK